MPSMKHATILSNTHHAGLTSFAFSVGDHVSQRVMLKARSTSRPILMPHFEASASKTQKAYGAFSIQVDHNNRSYPRRNYGFANCLLIAERNYTRSRSRHL